MESSDTPSYQVDATLHGMYASLMSGSLSSKDKDHMLYLSFSCEQKQTKHLFYHHLKKKIPTLIIIN